MSGGVVAPVSDRLLDLPQEHEVGRELFPVAVFLTSGPPFVVPPPVASDAWGQGNRPVDDFYVPCPRVPRVLGGTDFEGVPPVSECRVGLVTQI